MIYVTGDKHRDIDIESLSVENFPQQVEMTKEDYLIICGDFGVIWYPREHAYHSRDANLIKFYEQKNFTTLFVDGNHENFPEIYRYPIVDFCGGKAHKISDSIYHLIRGEIYVIEGKKFFCFGGATSRDKHLRLVGFSWWPEEIATREEMINGVINLNRVGNKVDYIISHCCSSKLLQSIWPYYEMDVMTQFFNYIDENVSFSHWYFGHYHENRKIDENHTCLYAMLKKIM